MNIFYEKNDRSDASLRLLCLRPDYNICQLDENFDYPSHRRNFMFFGTVRRALTPIIPNEIMVGGRGL